jgi:hypothetical protein
MSKPLFWITSAVFGVVAILMTSLGLMAFALFAVLAVVLVARGDRLVGASGLLTGFGAVWTFLMARSAGTTDNAAFWIAVGVVPLLFGCAMLVFIAAQSARSHPTSGT